MPTENFLSSLVINKVDTYDTFSKMMEREGVVKDDELYLIEQDGGFEGSIEQIQADWNQNDSEAPDYVKNRTHWAEVNLIPSIDNVTLQFPSEENGDWVELSVEYFNVYDYDTYCVIWDGVEYKCYLRVTDDDIAVLGGYDNGYPFQLVGASDWCNVYAYNENGDSDYNSTHTLTVSAMIETIHKLDEKYLPDFTKPLFVNIYYDGSDYATLSATFSEIDTAVTSGRTVIGVDNESLQYAPMYSAESGEYGSYSFIAHFLTGWVCIFKIDYENNVTIQRWKNATENYVNTAIATIPTPDVSGQIETHNTDGEAHPDIRQAIAQPDWNQNNSTAPDYIKNRTHGIVIEEQPVACPDFALVDKTLTFENGYIGGLWANLGYEGEFGFGEVGRAYTVTWDGTTYECECYLQADEWGSEWPAIGGFDKGCPFLITYIDNWLNQIYAYDSNGVQETGATTHTLSVYETIETVYKLDPKYLPNFNVTFTYKGDGAYICDRTFEEIKTAYDGGSSIIGVNSDDGSIYTLSYIDESEARFGRFMGTGFITLYVLEDDTVERKTFDAVNKSGDYMRGSLELNSDPTSEMHAATKQYVDNTVAAIPTPDVSGQIGTHNTDGDAHPDIRQLVANASSVKVYTGTIGTTWTENEDTGVKSQNVAIAGVLAKHTAKVDHLYTGNGTADGYALFVEEENQYLTYITNGYAETYDGGVTFYIFGDAPTVAIPIVVEVA